MTIRNFTRQIEHSNTIVTTSYLVKLKSLSSYIDFTKTTENKLPETSVDFTATSEGIKDQTEIVGNRTSNLSAKETTTRNKHKNPSSTCCDVTSTPTPRDTTFKPALTDAREGNDLWWLFILPFIGAILLIATAIVVFKKKNR